LHEQAKAAGVPAITTAGVSNGTHIPMIEYLTSELLFYFVFKKETDIG
jgi:hypothetical protein